MTNPALELYQTCSNFSLNISFSKYLIDLGHELIWTWQWFLVCFEHHCQSEPPKVAFLSYQPAGQLLSVFPPNMQSLVPGSSIFKTLFRAPLCYMPPLMTSTISPFLLCLAHCCLLVLYGLVRFHPLLQVSG